MKLHSRARTNQRLMALEAIAEESRRRREASRRSAGVRANPLDKVVLFLDLMQTQRGPKESFLEAVSRAIGITVEECRAQLKAGIDPMHEHLKRTGILDEIKRIQAEGEF